MAFWKSAPKPEDVLGMEPEELAPFVLRYLQQQPENSRNRYNFSLLNDLELAEYLGRLGSSAAGEYGKCLMEAWMWLEREGFIAPQPGQQEGWAFVTRKGRRVVEAEDFDAYKQSSLFPANVDPILTRVSRADFVRGAYDAAVFNAFKEVEVRVRDKARLSNSDIGIELMKRAFGPTGALTDKSATPAEQERVRDLFVGSIGIFKNPASHRYVHFESAGEAADMITMANQLLRMVERAASLNSENPERRRPA